MLQVYKEIANAADAVAPVLVVGESGTGKELVARAIHEHGPRSGRPFVAINSGALAETLPESELFGHVRGSFTGAVADKKGLVRAGRGFIGAFLGGFAKFFWENWLPSQLTWRRQQNVDREKFLAHFRDPAMRATSEVQDRVYALY